MIRIDAPTLEAATRLAGELARYRARLLETDGTWGVEVEPDREFNKLLLDVLAVTDAYLAREPETSLTLVVEGRSYALHPPAGVA
jgi:hypothetical protein